MVILCESVFCGFYNVTFDQSMIFPKSDHIDHIKPPFLSLEE